MRVLMVGAGAVGQVYGLHLQRGGAEVAFFVKPAYAEACERGMTLYRRQIGRPTVTERLDGCRIVTDLEAVRSESWDQVWLCVSTPALQGAWLAELLGAIGTATLVVLQPGLGVRQTILAAWRSAMGDGVDEATLTARIVTGLITAVAYQAPLPGEPAMAPGVAFWLPPLSPLPLGGDKGRIDPIVAIMRAGGCPTTYADDIPRRALVGSAMLMPQIAALEVVGWSMTGLRRSEWLDVACRASRQMVAVGFTHEGLTPPAIDRIARPWLLGTILWLAPKVVPLPFETYLQYHFTKVGDQTRLMLARHRDLGDKLGLDVSAIRALAEALPTLPPTKVHQGG